MQLQNTRINWLARNKFFGCDQKVAGFLKHPFARKFSFPMERFWWPLKERLVRESYSAVPSL